MVRFDPTRPDFSPYGFSCVRWTPTTMSRSDRHNEIEINLLEGGTLVYLMGGQKAVVPAGPWAAFWAGIPHQIIEFECLAEYFVLTIPLAWFLQWRLPDRLTQPILRGRMIVEPDKGLLESDRARLAGSETPLAVSNGNCGSANPGMVQIRVTTSVARSRQTHGGVGKLFVRSELC